MLKWYMIALACKIMKIPLTFVNFIDRSRAFSIFYTRYKPRILIFGACLFDMEALPINASLNIVNSLIEEDDPGGILRPRVPPCILNCRIMVEFL